MHYRCITVHFNVHSFLSLTSTIIFLLLKSIAILEISLLKLTVIKITVTYLDFVLLVPNHSI